MKLNHKIAWSIFGCIVIFHFTVSLLMLKKLGLNIFWLAWPLNFHSTDSWGIIIISLFFNDFFSIFTCVFAGACFEAESKAGKFFAYPLGFLLLSAILLGLGIPIGVIGLLIGVCVGGR